jgi:hypothetical protein
MTLLQLLGRQTRASAAQGLPECITVRFGDSIARARGIKGLIEKRQSILLGCGIRKSKAAMPALRQKVQKGRAVVSA